VIRLNKKLIKNLRSTLEWGWVVLLVLICISYAITNWDNLYAQLSQVSGTRLILSAIGIAVGYMCVVSVMRSSLAYVDWKPSYAHVFYINAVCQLAKYVPGSILQYIGRAGFYTAGGLNVTSSLKVMILEIFWLISSALLLGSISLLLHYEVANVWIVLIMVVILWWGVLHLVARVFFHKISWRVIIDLLTQLVMWGAFGLSFWVLLPGEQLVIWIPYIVGSFCFAWVVGYVAFFAPGGLGVRETVLVGLLAILFPAPQIIVYMAIHRTIWLMIEVLNGFIGHIIHLQVRPFREENMNVAKYK
jgi:glycosyltransferase 2 family protein